MTIHGGNVHADSQLTADIGGDLTVESLQNRSRTKDNSLGISAGTSFGDGGVTGANAGLNASNGMSVTRETVRSSLTSGGTADITVAGNTQIIAATIGTIDEEGNDLGNLNLTTGSLNFTNLRDINQSSQTSGSLSTSVSIGGGSGSELAKDGKGREMTVNTTNLTYSNTSEYSAGNAMATLGTGTITVGGTVLEENGELTEAGQNSDSPLAGLNRDTTDTTYELWDVERTEGNIDLQVDHRMLSEEGRAEIRQQIRTLPDNLEQVANKLVDDIERMMDPGAGRRAASNAEIMATVREYLEGLSEEERQEVMRHVGVFIDGTGNNKYKDMASGAETNVAILSELYQGENTDPLYYPGVGTNWFTSALCGLTGCGGQVRVNQALEDIAGQWGGGDNILMIDVTGFSRGSAQSVELINTIITDGIPGVPQENIVINGAYLFDTVSATGLPGNGIDFTYDLVVPTVVPTFHSTANEEFRGLFDLQSQNYSDGTSPPNVLEQGFFGAHSDIGGGYAPGDQGIDNTLSTIPLQWMHDNAVNNGAPFLPIPAQYEVPPELQQLYDQAASGDENAYQELKDKYIHDSRYFWEQDRDERTVYHPRGEAPNEND